MREIDIGGRLMRDMKRRRRTTLLKFESVRPGCVSECGSSLLGGSERTGKESVELHQELEVDIVTLGRLAMAAPNVVTIEVDTCQKKLRLARSSCAACGLVSKDCCEQSKDTT